MQPTAFTYYRSRTPILTILAACVIVVALGALISTGDTTPFLIALIAACGIALFLAPAWWGLIIYFTYSAFSPLLKFVAAYNTIVHLGPTLVLLSVLFRWLSAQRGRNGANLGVGLARLPLVRLVGAFVALSVLMMFSPLTTPIVALGGIISYILPVVFFPIAFTELRTRRRISVFITTTVALAVLGTILTLFFVAIGPQRVASFGPAFATAALNPGNAYIDASGQHQGYLPLTVVGGGGSYIIALLLLMAILIYRATFMARTANVVLAAPLIVVLAASIIAGGVRLSIASTIIGLLVVVLAGRRRAIVPTLVGLGLAILALNAAASLTNGAAIVRAATLLNPAQALKDSGRTSLIQQIIPLALNHPLGQGMGRVGPGSGSVIAASGASITSIGYDNMLLAILSELGLVGAILLSAIAVMFVVQGWRVYRRLSDPGLKSVALACTASSVALTSSWVAGPILFQAPGNIYFWALAGLCFALPYVEQRERQDGQQ